MKNYGAIYPNGDKELLSVVSDDDGNPQMDTLRPNPAPDDWEPPVLVPLVKIPKPQAGYWQANLVWFDDRVERQWVEYTPTQAELDALAAADADAAEATAIKNMVAKLQNPGADTQAQRITRIERILVQLIKQAIQ